MSIVKKCMTVNLRIGQWTGQRLDRVASENVTRDAHAESDAARVNKHLVPKMDLKPIGAAASKIRLHYYDMTLPWKDSGDRLLTRKMFPEFIERHEELVGEFKVAVEHFISEVYPKVKEKAAFRMGELFDADDYPSPEALRRKFYAHLDFDAVTEADDFRVEMDQASLDKIKGDIESATQARVTKAMADVWNRLSTVVGHFADKMGSDEIFRNTTVENLDELARLLPALNLTDDPELDKIGAEISATLVGYDPATLRKEPAVRKEAAEKANKIMEDMRGFMSAMSAAA